MLLAPASAYKDDDGGKNSAIENGEYTDDEAQRLLDDSHSDYESGNVTSYATSADSDESDSDSLFNREEAQATTDFITPTNGNATIPGAGDMSGHSNGNGLANGHLNGVLEAHKKKQMSPKASKACQSELAWHLSALQVPFLSPPHALETEFSRPYLHGYSDRWLRLALSCQGSSRAYGTS